MNAPVRYEPGDGIATITLDDGKANVMNVAMLHAIGAALDRAAKDKAVTLIQGRAGMFSGGFDLAVFKGDPQGVFDMLKAGAELTERLLGFPHPVIAVCTGHAVAMGAFLLLSADVRIGTKADARVQVNEVQIGMTLPHFAIEICRQRLSPAHFNLAAVTAMPYSQQQAVAAGFLDEVVAPESLDEVLRSRMAHLRSLHGEAFGATKLRLRSQSLAMLRAAFAKDLEVWSKQLRSGAA